MFSNLVKCDLNTSSWLTFRLFTTQSLKMKRNVLLLLAIISSLCIIDECNGYGWPRLPRIPRLPRYPRYQRYPRWARHPQYMQDENEPRWIMTFKMKDIEIGDLEDRHIDERNVNMNDDVTNDIDEHFMTDIDEHDVNDIDERYVDDSQNDD
ncbi:unnamed protein product [Mytilus coruscus]|uniref:Uncharacterized protein n=1 Tax=Mytilus coruscus TaxID=42192 RepID=A0A6J8APM7_MYTCO|nr:unnamed protein product [Mytilus coruscus]